MLEPLDFDDGEHLLLRSAVRYIDDFSLQQILSVKFSENLAGIGDIYVTDSKIDPSVSHILRRLSAAARSVASFRKALSIAYARAYRDATRLLSTENNGPTSTLSDP